MVVHDPAPKVPVEVAAVGGSKRNTDAGVGRDLMPKTIIWLADGSVNSLDQLHDIAGLLDAGLDDCKFVAAEPGHEIRGSDATL